MTADEILSLPAGRELDALIAERLFGWRWHNCEYIGQSSVASPVYRTMFAEPKELEKNTSWRCVAMDNPHSGVRKKQEWTPHYSTSIADAWQVVEHIWNVLEKDISVTFAAGSISCDIGDLLGEAVAEVFADTAPLAICRAALLAMTP